MGKRKFKLGIAGLLLFFISCNEKKPQQEVKTSSTSKPNIVLIMVDDMGYECLSVNGSTEYNTPNLDQLAANGANFNYCISQPLCTPSRVKIMTGLYNSRNYVEFGYLDTNQTTFAQIAKQAGYKTAITGKWQLNGLNMKENSTKYDNSRPNHFGFDTYCLWQLSKGRAEGERFANPLIEQNGDIIPTTIDDYGPDIFTQFAIDFIDDNKDTNFFLYYPMVLVHAPFVPTPDSKAWVDSTRRYEQDTVYYKDMVEYTDKLVGKIYNKLKEENLDSNTIFIFTCDNGSSTKLINSTTTREVTGAKGSPIMDGDHVPFIIHYPNGIKPNTISNEMVSLADVFPTVAEATGQEANSDGKSLLSVVNEEGLNAQKQVLINYEPRHMQSKKLRDISHTWVQDQTHKMYSDGRVYNFSTDILEEKPLSDEEKETISQKVTQFDSILTHAPKWQN